MKKHLCQAMAFVAAVLFADPVFAASIEWLPVQSTTSNAANDIVDGGDVVLAINGRSQTDSSSRRPPPSVRLDGIAFESAPIQDFLGRRATDIERSLSLPISTGDLNYDAFLTHVAFADVSAAGLRGSDSNAIYPIAGLEVDSEYLVQLWYTDERPSAFSSAVSRTTTFGDNERVENKVEVPGEGENGFGSFVVGNFVADGVTQDLRLTTSNANRAHLTGILVRETLPACAMGTGDFDNNGVVEFADFLVLSLNFGAETGPRGGDMDCSGAVDFADFLLFSRNFGQATGGAQSVPEPRGEALWMIAALGLTLVRKRRA